MSISATLRNLASAIEDLESRGVTVEDVDTEEFPDDGRVTVALSTALAFPEVDVEGVDLRPVEASVDGDRIAVEVSAACDADPESAVDGPPDRDADSEATPPHRDPDRLREVYEEHDSFAAMTEALGADVAANTVRRNMIKHGIHDPEADEETEEGSTPPHRDPERLRAVYEEHDSFPEMTGALGADVTPQTVRRRMIEHGIHDPDARGAADEGDGGTRTEAATDDSEGDGAQEEAAERDGAAEVTLTDGIDLPDGASLEDLKAAVASARTVHEVGRALGVERDRARRLLEELDLLDLAGGRLAEDHEVPREEIEERIRRAAPGDA